MTDFSHFPAYCSHKVVRAGRIVTMPPGKLGVALGDAPGVHEVEIDEAKLYARGIPKEGDYLVIYEDGYQSISPKAAFESGYTLLDA